MLKGIDIGGSFIKVLWEDGRREKYPVREIKESKELFLEKVREVVLEGNPEGVGVAVAGFTSLEGKVFRSPNIPVLDGVDLLELIGDTGIRVAVGNDVSVGAYGEWFFDYRDRDVLILVAVGTGLGGGLVIGGEPFFGVSGSAMEVGHHIILKDGRECRCGRRGCWEAYCSSYGLEEIYRELGGEEISDFEIVRRAKEGEERALASVHRFKEFLCIGLLNLVHTLNPDQVVLGGGLVESLKDFLGDTGKRVKELAETLPGKSVSVSFSKAGEFLGARGALALIKSRL